MNWSKTISWWEITIGLAFLLIYVFYFFRMFKIGKSLGKPSKAIYFKFFLRSSYLVLIIIAILGPSFGISETEARSSGKDILFAVDLSASMDCTDLAPSRLERAKLEIINLIEQSKGDRIGVMVFSSKAYWQIPLTFDLTLVKEFVTIMNTSMMPNTGSNLEAPMVSLQEKLMTNSVKNRSKLAFLFTDGESFNEVTENTKKLLRQSKDQLILVGIGTENGAEVLIDNTPVLLENGNPAISKLDKVGLTKLSRSIGSKLYVLNNEKNNLENALKDIKNIQSAALDRNKLLVTNNKYQNFLLVALILVALDIIISTKVFQI